MKKVAPILAVLTPGIILSAFIVFKGLKMQGEEIISTENLFEASFYEQLESEAVQCNLCPNRCILEEGQRGLCKVRQNIKGKLYSLVYGKPVSIHVDPIEKKPLYHFLPSSTAYSLATAGCNLECKYCQNWDIAQRFPEDLESTPMTPEEVVNAAIKSKSEVIAFTYNEPTVWYEYMFDIAKLAKEKSLKTVAISSGFINQKPLKQLLPYMDAYKVDLKSFNEETYTQLLGGRLQPVLDTIKTVYESGTWLEIVYLVVPGYTDNIDEIEKMCTWIKENTNENVPVHFSRFWPKYKLLNLPPTPEKTLVKARQTCMDAGMKYVYTGNIDNDEGNTTYCPENQKPLLIRHGFSIELNLIDSEGKAPNCSVTIPGVWK